MLCYRYDVHAMLPKWQKNSAPFPPPTVGAYIPCQGQGIYSGPNQFARCTDQVHISRDHWERWCFRDLYHYSKCNAVCQQHLVIYSCVTTVDLSTITQITLLIHNPNPPILQQHLDGHRRLHQGEACARMYCPAQHKYLLACLIS